ncbi:NodT family efflux transporter outer membrane factor (OMF) lipoprotein [Rhizobium sp. WW_1]|jgi:NodT family efflux transporter outer membrane factor (OMF) lipoprotein|nr:NodT family efflux transporter outer membrane factor (OMF) lipoprotein [Rhizobium sp. WW_1]
MDLSPPVSAPQLPVAYAGLSQRSPEATFNGTTWWEGFHDKTLSSLVSRAGSSNLTIAQAEQNLLAARALGHSAIAGYRPEVGTVALANASTGSRVNNDFTRRPLQLNLEVGWEAALFGQDKQTQRSADLTTEMASEDLAAARLAVAAEIAASYVHLRALQQRHADTVETIALLQKNSELADVRERVGLSTAIETEPQKSGIETAKSRLADLENEINTSAQQIATLQGSATPAASLLKPQPQPIAPARLMSGRPADLLRSRPDVRRAELAVAQAGAQVGLARSELYPKLRLSGTIGIGAPIDSSLFGASGGPSLQIPIFDLGKRKDVVTASEAKFREAGFAYRQTVLVAYEEASRALREFNAAQRKTAQLKSKLKRVTTVRNGADILVREGLEDRSKSIRGALDVLELRASLTDSIEDEARAFIAFYKATGAAEQAARPRASERLK